MIRIISLGLFFACVLSAGFSVHAAEEIVVEDDFVSGDDTFQEHCAVCHGEQMQGAPQGTLLVGQSLVHGDSMQSLTASIANGFPDKGMPAWADILQAWEINTLALLIRENREGWSDQNFVKNLEFPTEPIRTQMHSYRIERVIDGLDRRPYSITVLPDGMIVVSEKMRGLRVISPEGKKSELIVGTPETHSDVFTIGGGGVEFGMGWLLDVEAHPDYDKNGWIYLHYTERCTTCGGVVSVDNPPKSRNVLVRGRIEDGRWIDQETIWKPAIFDFNYYLDVVAGGRIAFDPDGFVFITVGMRAMDTPQDLRSPYGKTHRVHDDGRIPTDNPFINDAKALDTIWTYGHRSPQGLAFDAVSGQLWGTEHGPRGGDEINLLLPGRNYGWPLFSRGQNYDGTEVAWGREESEIELGDIEQPVVDWTPSPAISNLVMYEGDAFPGWRGQFLVGSLKASDLYRVKIVDNKFAEQEVLVDNLARIRDIDVDKNGLIYLLLEHDSGGQIVRLIPD